MAEWPQLRRPFFNWKKNPVQSFEGTMQAPKEETEAAVGPGETGAAVAVKQKEAAVGPGETEAAVAAEQKEAAVATEETKATAAAEEGDAAVAADEAQPPVPVTEFGAAIKKGSPHSPGNRGSGRSSSSSLSSCAAAVSKKTKDQAQPKRQLEREFIRAASPSSTARPQQGFARAR